MHVKVIMQSLVVTVCLAAVVGHAPPEPREDIRQSGRTEAAEECVTDYDGASALQASQVVKSAPLKPVRAQDNAPDVSVSNAAANGVPAPLRVKPNELIALAANGTNVATTFGLNASASSIGAYTMPALFVIALLATLTISKHCAEMLQGVAAYAAEFVGTFALVFTVGCCVLAGNPTWSPTAIASTLMVMVYATGSISGGHLNPAVSFAFGLTGKLKWSEVVGYWVAQLVGGVWAAISYYSIFAPRAATLAPVAPFRWCHSGLAEVIFTAMLCFVVLNCAASKRNNPPADGNQFYALAIGSVVIAGGYAVGGVSGAAFNPAVALSLDLLSVGDGMKWGFLWSGFELMGAVVAVCLFYMVRPEESSDAVDDAEDGAKLPARCASEFLGTFALVLTVGLNVVMASPAVAYSAAAALMCMVYSLGSVSGAHFNPAVTAAVVAGGREKCTLRLGAAYVCAQAVGAVCAGVVVSYIHTAGPHHDKAFDLAPQSGYSWYLAGAVEAFFTFVLSYVVLAVATVKPAWPSQTTGQSFYFALAIASCVTAGGFAIGGISGGELNPAVSLGLTVVSGVHRGSIGLSQLTALLGLSACEIAGGLAAALVFRVTHAKEFGYESVERVSAYACEFLGTFVLVFTVGCCVLTGNSVWNATAIASALMVMIYATAPVSGGNLNPAVSFALGLAGKLGWSDVLLYSLAQTVGGVLASLCFCALLSPRSVILAPVSPFTWVHSMVVEVIYTGVLCFVVLNCAASKRNNPESDGNQFFGLAISSVIIAGGYAVGGISGAAFNPAVALGLDASSTSDTFGWGFAWTLFELCGAFLAAVLFKLVRPEEGLSDVELSSYSPSLLVRCVSEALGVFVLVLTIGLNLLMASPAVAFSAAAALTCMIYALGDVSGAHFNPAVTLAVAASGRGKCSSADGIAYSIVQVLAGTCAGLLVRTFHTASPNTNTSYRLSPGADYSAIQAGALEMFFTFILAYVVLAVATAVPPASQATGRNFYFALAIGSCIIAGGCSIGAVSGAELNPAVSAGIVAASGAFDSIVAYTMWQLTGAVLAATAFQVTHAQEYTHLSYDK